MTSLLGAGGAEVSMPDASVGALVGSELEQRCDLPGVADQQHRESFLHTFEDVGAADEVQRQQMAFKGEGAKLERESAIVRAQLERLDREALRLGAKRAAFKAALHSPGSAARIATRDTSVAGNAFAAGSAARDATGDASVAGDAFAAGSAARDARGDASVAGNATRSATRNASAPGDAAGGAAENAALVLGSALITGNAVGRVPHSIGDADSQVINEARTTSIHLHGNSKSTARKTIEQAERRALNLSLSANNTPPHNPPVFLAALQSDQNPKAFNKEELWNALNLQDLFDRVCQTILIVAPLLQSILHGIDESLVDAQYAVYANRFVSELLETTANHAIAQGDALMLIGVFQTAL